MWKHYHHHFIKWKPRKYADDYAWDVYGYSNPDK